MPTDPTAAYVREEFLVPSAPGIELFVRGVRLRDEPPPPGVPVLLLHGARAAGVASFDLPVAGGSLAADLAAAGHPVFVLDARGYGGSTRPPVMGRPPAANPPLVRSHEVVRDIAAAVEAIQARRGGPGRAPRLGHRRPLARLLRQPPPRAGQPPDRPQHALRPDARAPLARPRLRPRGPGPAGTVRGRRRRRLPAGRRRRAAAELGWRHPPRRQGGVARPRRRRGVHRRRPRQRPGERPPRPARLPGSQWGARRQLLPGYRPPALGRRLRHRPDPDRPRRPRLLVAPGGRPAPGRRPGPRPSRRAARPAGRDPPPAPRPAGAGARPVPPNGARPPRPVSARRRAPSRASSAHELRTPASLRSAPARERRHGIDGPSFDAWTRPAATSRRGVAAAERGRTRPRPPTTAAARRAQRDGRRAARPAAGGSLDPCRARCRAACPLPAGAPRCRDRCHRCRRRRFPSGFDREEMGATPVRPGGRRRRRSGGGGARRSGRGR